MDLGRRLDRIEKRENQNNCGKGCPVCGDGVPGYEPDYRVVTGDDDQDDGPTHCPACGRQRVFVITFDQQG